MKGSLCFALFFLAAGSALAKEPSLVGDKELALGGIALGDTEAVVLASLGRARRTTDNGDFLNVKMEYSGLTVWLGEERRVGEMLSTSPKHCTPAGVCPGMPFAQLVAKYGPPLVADREDGRFMEYPSSQSSCWLQISVHKGVVKSVRAECQP